MFTIICSSAKTGAFSWTYRPETLEEALGVGRELVRDRVCVHFKVRVDGWECPFNCTHNEMFVDLAEGDGYPRCESCGTC